MGGTLNHDRRPLTIFLEQHDEEADRSRGGGADVAFVLRGDSLHFRAFPDVSGDTCGMERDIAAMPDRCLISVEVPWLAPQAEAKYACWKASGG